jgi:DNA-binding NarL/FixJ family response regulator
LADDHKVVCQGFRLILSRQPDMEVVGEAYNGREAVELAISLEPDIVVLDIAMPEVNGVEATRQILRDVPRTKIVILTMHKDGAYVREALRAGAKGYLLKDSIDRELAAAVRAVSRGEAYLSPSVSATVLEHYQEQVTDPMDQITNRERQVLQLLAEGKTSKDVAVDLNISVYTVDAHRSRIMKKLQLRTGRDLVRFALQRGLL